MKKIIFLSVLIFIGATAFAQSEASDKGYLRKSGLSGSLFHCEDGVLFLTYDNSYKLGKEKRGETLVKFPQNKQTSSYTIPDGVTNIAKGAFQGNKNIRAIRIPSSVYYIGEDAFADCDQLQSIEMYESTSSVRAIENDESHSNAREVGRYNIQGMKIEEGEDGQVQIILYSDGTTEKIIK